MADKKSTIELPMNEIYWVTNVQKQIGRETKELKVVRRFLRSLKEQSGLVFCSMYRVESRGRILMKEAFEIRGVPSYPNQYCDALKAQLEVGVQGWAEYREGLNNIKLLGSQHGFLLVGNGSLRRLVMFQTSEAPSMLLDILVRSVQNSCRLIGRYDKVQTLVNRDDLTDLYNFRFLEACLDSEIKRCQRFEATFSLLFIDIDNFKPINDQYGHLVGSHVLKELAMVIKDDLREVDSVFRYGGDEFVVLLVESDQQAGYQTAERIRAKVEAYSYSPTKGQEVKVTASIGVAAYPTHAATKEGLIAMADKSMYASKRGGKNKVVVVDESICVTTIGENSEVSQG